MLGYILTQLAQRLTTASAHPDEDVSQRARRRAEQWHRLLEGISSGEVEVGSRIPVRKWPTWVTLEVLKGGFASGSALAAGPLQEHEQRFSLSDRGEINGHYLSPQGLAELRDMLDTGCYRLDLPEEGAWLVLAWLERHGHLEQAAQLTETLLPFCRQLRFYPIPQKQPESSDLRVHVQTVGEVRASLDATRPNPRVMAQKETIEVWLPLYDRLLGLFQQLQQEGDPGPDWDERARQWLEEYNQQRKLHTLCRRPERRKHSFAQLRLFLEKGRAHLSQADHLRIGQILRRSEQKRGLPGSPQFQQARQQQRQAVQAPTRQQLAKLLSRRLAELPPQQGLEDVAPVCQPTPEGYPIPAFLLEKVERCLHASLEELVESGRIASGEVLAKVVPQLISQLRAAEFEDPALGRLYAAIYRAFRQRRSLLLLNLQSQVRLEELPWLAAIQPWQGGADSTRGSAAPALRSLSQAALNAFPQAILPNKLVREMRALATSAGLPNLVFTDELAADIFAGAFAPHYAQAARQAQEFLRDSLYQTYYSIRPGNFENLADLCQTRAGVQTGGTAGNGQIIEQQQILTTHNLATLFQGLNLQLDSQKLALACLLWIVRRLQLPQPNWRDRLLSIKNSAYAWRQMLFFLSLGGPEKHAAFVEQAEQLLHKQGPQFQKRFAPAWQGLLQAMRGEAPERPFLGWASGRHWLMPPNP
ncbi:MAG: hypothetical protein U0931_19935 [Vulcanimicrobiota bacterium]